VGWIESQIQIVTNRVEYLFRLLQDLTQQIRGLQKGLQGAYQQWEPNQDSGGATCYFADNLNLAGATGTWPSITPSSGSYTVYYANGGALVSLGSKIVYNFMPDGTDNTKRQILGKNADATFSVIAQSCTNG
jgi:hypothetical protein